MDNMDKSFVFLYLSTILYSYISMNKNVHRNYHHELFGLQLKALSKLSETKSAEQAFLNDKVS